jgi:hypothetical protein
MPHLNLDLRPALNSRADILLHLCDNLHSASLSVYGGAMGSVPGFENLKTLVRNVSRSRLVHQGLIPTVDLAEVAEPMTVYSHWMAIILLVGPRSKLTFKVHFKTQGAQAYAGPLYAKPPEQISQSQALDCMREYCNLTAGGIKQSLLAHLELNLSLPVVCRGFDELFFSRDQNPQVMSDQWKLIFKENELICTCLFELDPDINVAQVQ